MKALAVECGVVSMVLPKVENARPQVVFPCPFELLVVATPEDTLYTIIMSPTTSQLGLLHKSRSTWASAAMRFSLFARCCCASSLMK